MEKNKKPETLLALEQMQSKIPGLRTESKIAAKSETGR
jgi:hypothetical protein